jgi:chromosome segregation ATPase
MGVHFRQNTHKEHVGQLADILSSMIQQLNNLCEKLACEVNRFNQENNTFADNITELSSQIEQLTLQIEEFKLTEQNLRATNSILESTATTLKNTTDEQASLLQSAKEQHAQNIEEHEQNQIKLTAQIIELTEVKTKIELELIRVKAVAETLEGSVTFLAKAAIGDKNQKEAFFQKLTAFLSDKKRGLEEFAGTLSQSAHGISALENELKNAIAHYNQLTQQYSALIDRYEKSVDRLEQGISKAPDQNASAKALGKLGIYAVNSELGYRPISDALDNTLPCI